MNKPMIFPFPQGPAVPALTRSAGCFKGNRHSPPSRSHSLFNSSSPPLPPPPPCPPCPPLICPSCIWLTSPRPKGHFGTYNRGTTGDNIPPGRSYEMYIKQTTPLSPETPPPPPRLAPAGRKEPAGLFIRRIIRCHPPIVPSVPYSRRVSHTQPPYAHRLNPAPGACRTQRQMHRHPNKQESLCQLKWTRDREVSRRGLQAARGITRWGERLEWKQDT